jgi:hypothetical protein
VVECPGFDAIVGAAEIALARIAGVLGGDAQAHRERAQHVTDAIVDHLFDERTARSGPATCGPASSARPAASTACCR